MRKILLLTVGVAFTVVSCKDNNAASSLIDRENAAIVTESRVEGEYPSIVFEKAIHDFGDVANNELVTAEIELTNTGKADLIIIDARATCGCTVPSYQKTPIKPGEKSKLTISFQSAASGVQQKSVTLVTNTANGEETLMIRANVAPRLN